MRSTTQQSCNASWCAVTVVVTSPAGGASGILHELLQSRLRKRPPLGTNVAKIGQGANG